MFNCLIIDDEKPVIKAIKAQIIWQKLNISMPISASNGKEGLETMRQYHPEIVFVDMHMPVMNGIDFLKLASIEFPESQYIVISGYDEFSYAQEALKSGAIDYILKPIIKTDLEQALSRATKNLTQTVPFSPQIKTFSNSCIDELNVIAVIDIIHEYIEKNYSSTISVGMFSDKYFFSKEHLSKQFKKKYTMGIYEYLLSVRMHHAKILLSQSTFPIKEIARRVGYSNNNYFSKAFKTFYNLSPSEFREKQH